MEHAKLRMSTLLGSARNSCTWVRSWT